MESKNLIFKLLWVILAAGVIGTVALTAVFSLPTEKIREHVKDSVTILEQETTYFSVTSGVRGTQIDNFTEAMYLNQAMVDGNPFECALSGYTYRVGNNSSGPVADLIEVTNNFPEATQGAECARFFNGYELIVKPMLMITKYGHIRQLNLYLVFVTFMFLCYLMLKNNLGIYIVPFMLAFLYINPVTVAVTLTFVFFYYCSVIPCIIILLANEWLKKGYRYYIFFEIVGICAFYFNMNYFQLITFGFPLTFYYLLNGLPAKKLDVISKSLAFFGVWFLGYAGIMLFKWVLYAVFYNHDFFEQMYNHILFRASDHYGDVSFSRWKAVAYNVHYVVANWPWFIMEVLFVITCIYRWVKNKASFRIDRKLMNIEKTFVAFMIMLPLVRYFIYANHVSIHHWVTYRILAMSIFAFNIFLIRYCCGKIGKYESS